MPADRWWTPVSSTRRNGEGMSVMAGLVAMVTVAFLVVRHRDHIELPVLSRRAAAMALVLGLFFLGVAVATVGAMAWSIDRGKSGDDGWGELAWMIPNAMAIAGLGVALVVWARRATRPPTMRRT